MQRFFAIVLGCMYLLFSSYVVHAELMGVFDNQMMMAEHLSSPQMMIGKSCETMADNNNDTFSIPSKPCFEKCVSDNEPAAFTTIVFKNISLTPLLGFATYDSASLSSASLFTKHHLSYNNPPPIAQYGPSKDFVGATLLLG